MIRQRHPESLFVITPYTGFADWSCFQHFESRAISWPLPALAKANLLTMELQAPDVKMQGAKRATTFEDFTVSSTRAEQVFESGQMTYFLASYAPHSEALEFVINQNLVDRTSLDPRVAGIVLFCDNPAAFMPRKAQAALKAGCELDAQALGKWMKPASHKPKALTMGRVLGREFKDITILPWDQRYIALSHKLVDSALSNQDTFQI